MDETDVYGTFTQEEAKRLGVLSALSAGESVKPGGESTSEKTPDHKDGLSYVLG